MLSKKFLLLFLLEYLRDKNNFVLLWDGKEDKNNFRTYMFTNPVEVTSCYKAVNLKSMLLKLEKEIFKGYYMAGFVSYEAGLVFENLLSENAQFDFPLIWFGIYKKPIIFNHDEEVFENNEKLNHIFSKYVPENKQNYRIKNLGPNLKKEEYVRNINSIKRYIEKGETYQVNYTFKHEFDIKGNSFDLFFHLCMKQSVSYAAFIRGFGKDVLCLSPELFFKKKKKSITVKPMKGTINRGRNNTEDEINRNWLHKSIKNRAENVMIVDLLRNDLGKISQIGSVDVGKLFEVEKYETLYQMISTIKSRLKHGISWFEIFRNIFPSGSVTGAPKISTMKIIKKIEKEPRKIYTGSIGYISPDNESVFNVAIRTVLVDKKAKKGEMGIGSGIVYDSDPVQEFNECLLKAKFLTDKYNDFQLIETMLYDNGRYFLLNLHLRRLKDSAKYFDFYYDESKIRKILDTERDKFVFGNKYKVRLLLDKFGKTTLTSTKLGKFKRNKLNFTFSNKKTNSENIFLYHKTTNRKLYNGEFRRARRQGYFDIMFTNGKGEVTEGAITNLVIKKDNKFYTPPLKSGLLNGVFRQYLFNTKSFPIQEKIFSKNDIFNVQKVYLVNSVRKMVECFPEFDIS